MSLNSTPSGERIHIGFFGRRNAGKSSLVNAVTNQELAIVSDTLGTTTDPVLKSMELLPLGPVVIIDTPGFDDVGALGEQRVKKTKQVLNRVDVAVLVIDSNEGYYECDKEMLALFKSKEIPYIVALNKADLKEVKPSDEHEICVSALLKQGIEELKEKIGSLQPTGNNKRIIGDKLQPSDFVVLVTPIDKAAPKGRLILPQQQAIRDVLDSNAIAIACTEFELKNTLASLGKKPAMVITDSQAFASVSKDTPEDIPLTSFSILLARYKGFLEEALKGVKAIENLKDGDTVLICEGCTHHRQCDDIGTVKIPNWLRKFTNANIKIVPYSGKDYPDNLTDYAVIIHCGGCMLTEKDMLYRMKCAQDQGVPFTNYGTVIAYMQGILKRSLSLFPELISLIND